MSIRITVSLLVCFLLSCSAGGTPQSRDGGGTPPGDTTSGCTPANCDDNIPCTVDRCEMGVCSHTPDAMRCSAGQTCGPRGCATARTCASDQNCADTDPCTVEERCDPTTRLCVSQLLDGDGDRHAPRSCGGNDCDDNNPLISPTAVEECNNADENCNGLIDDGADARCGLGSVCRAGRCECGMRCGTMCTDLSRDMNNCGACGNRCPVVASCIGGRCACPLSQPDRCDDRCTTLQAASGDCGACGHSCWPGLNLIPDRVMCVNGECQCPADANVCMVGGRRICTNFSSFPMHCGGCGRACPVPMHGYATCNSGVCGVECDRGFFPRGSECVAPACSGFSGACDPINDLGCAAGEHCSLLNLAGSDVEYRCQRGERGTQGEGEGCSEELRCAAGMICVDSNSSSVADGFCFRPCCGPSDSRCRSSQFCGSRYTFPAPYSYVCYTRA
jgi:hypothetical protein